MGDNNRAFPERNRILPDDYDLRYFADKNGITIEHARDLVRQFGNDQEKLLAAAKQLRERF